MAIQPYVAPAVSLSAFHCPFCGVYAAQAWGNVNTISEYGNRLAMEGWSSSLCSHCTELALWLQQKMIFPSGGSAPNPNPDLPKGLLADYEEARSIATGSPRGAAALLRLVIQKLCGVLEAPGKNINDDIAYLVQRGLPAGVQKALDAVRVIGNEAVHPGTIDLKDDSATVSSLFGLVNFIAEKMLTEPKEIERIYVSLPASKREAIDKRDGKSSQGSL